MNNRYKWGYYLIKIRAAFVLIVVIISLIYCLQLIYKSTIDIKLAKYIPQSVDIENIKGEINKLNNIVNRTSNDIKKVKNINNNDSVKLVTIKNEYKTSSDFDETIKQISEQKQNIQDIKNSLLQKLDTNLDKIIQKLSEYAKKIKVEKTQSTGEIIEIIGIYNNEKNVHDDKNQMKLLIEDIDGLVGLTENPDNREILRSSSEELQTLMEILDSYSRTFSYLPHIQKDQKVNAERAIDMLEHVKIKARIILLTDWMFDKQNDKVMDLVTTAKRNMQEEENKVSYSNSTIRKIIISMIVDIATVIVFTLLISFGVMVITDLTQAHLDTAISNMYIAEIYKSSTQKNESDDQSA